MPVDMFQSYENDDAGFEFNSLANQTIKATQDIRDHGGQLEANNTQELASISTLGTSNNQKNCQTIHTQSEHLNTANDTEKQIDSDVRVRHSQSLHFSNSLFWPILVNKDNSSLDDEQKIQIRWNVSYYADTIFALMFGLGALVYTAVAAKLAWNIITLCQQNLRIHNWVLGTLISGASALAFCLIYGMPLDYVQEFPTLFVWVTVLIGASIIVFIVGELSISIFSK
ncbi:hypothetical protein GGU10DRAFT_335664 [Lentinula aff. detonsa]|uniref:Uncharacterized protein n=1 Tax=Lentinula aff. detonsa TaxID=2804958 RepID=A0AA38NHY6_9AGAR|nr:hypothetical protein GGU10DRAFT_335664 [Lentinula aff. detonsa]